MRRLSLAKRVTIFAVVVATVVGVMFVAALLALHSVRRAEARESRSKDVTVATLGVQNLSVDVEAAVRGYALSVDPRFLDLYHQSRNRLTPALARLDRLVQGDTLQRRRAAVARQQINGYLADYADPVIVIASVDPTSARGQASSFENERRVAQIRGTLASITGLEQSRTVARAAHVRAVTRWAVVVGGCSLIASAALVILFGLWVARRVADPVRKTAIAATKVAAGDFDIRLEERGAGEVGILVGAFNSMTRALDSGRRELSAQNQHLRESERHKRDLISMVSHELRTPLASVLGFTALLLEREFSPEEQRRYLEIVDQQARRLAGLANDFLDVQLLEGGLMTLVRTDVDLTELTQEQIRLFFSQQTNHHVEVELPESPVVVDGDRDRLAQVIGNLLSNALKYSPAGGVVRIQLFVAGDTATLGVHDQGMGIPPEDQERIFEKFFRVPAAAAVVGGTGLGLAVAREIVTTHGGALRVASEPGVGTTFWVELPVRSRNGALGAA